MVTVDRVSLVTLARGAAIERFDDELERVIQNVLDPNAGDGARRITLEVAIKPAADRSTASVYVSCHTKLAPPRPTQTMFYLGRGKDGAFAYEHNPNQLSLVLNEPKVVNPKEKEREEA